MKRDRINLADEVVNEFLDAINNGVFSYGEKLPSQDKLAQYFDVSRSVIREALNKLSVMGLVYFRQGKGTYIKSSEEMVSLPVKLMEFTFRSDENLVSILEARRIIEKEICILAAIRRNVEDCEVIREILHQMIANEANVKEYAKYDLEFHLAIAKASKNTILHQLLHMIKDLYWNEMMQVFNIEGILAKSTKAHKEIYQAIHNKDPIKASKAMEEHLKIPEMIIKNR